MMISINQSIKRSRATLVALLIVGLTVSTAHSELIIQEKDPDSSITNQYAALKNADVQSPQLHQLIEDLNQRLSLNPNDSLAWEILSEIYYNHGYHAYALYAASEAVSSGQSTEKLKKILLNSSAIVSKSQLQSDYLTDDLETDFLEEYQYALSKIYGEVYGFNYDESLPKPVAFVVKPRAAKAKSKTRAQSRPSTQKKTQVALSKRKAIVKQNTQPVPKSKPVKQLVKQSSPKSSNAKSTDPFSILR